MQAPSASGYVPDGDTVDLEDGKGKTLDSVSMSPQSTNDQLEKQGDPCRDQLTGRNQNNSPASSPTDASDEISGYIATGTRNNLVKSSDPAASISWHGKETGDKTNMKQLEDTVSVLLVI